MLCSDVDASSKVDKLILQLAAEKEKVTTLASKLAIAEEKVASLAAENKLLEKGVEHATNVAKLEAERDIYAKCREAQEAGYNRAIQTMQLLQGNFSRGPPPSASSFHSLDSLHSA